MVQLKKWPWTNSSDGQQILTGELPDSLDTLATRFSGAVAPVNPLGLQDWDDTATNWHMRRDEANTAWLKLSPFGDIVSRWQEGELWGTVSASRTEFLGDRYASTIEAVTLRSTTATSSSSGNEIQFDLFNVTAAVSLFSGVVGTFTTLGGVGGGEVLANTQYVLIPDQNADVAGGDTLELRMTWVGAPAAGTLTRLRVKLYGYRR